MGQYGHLINSGWCLPADGVKRSLLDRDTLLDTILLDTALFDGSGEVVVAIHICNWTVVGR